MTAGDSRLDSSRWRLIVALGLIGLALGFLWGIADTPTWSATAGVAVESDSEGAVQARLERFAQRGESREVATQAAGLLGSDVSGADLLSDVDVRPAREGGAVLVTATSESPDYAAAAADGYAEALVRVEGDPLTLGSAASIPTSPTESRSAAIAALGGLLAGVGVGLVMTVAMSLAARRRGSESSPAADEPAAVMAARFGVPVLDHDARQVVERLGLGAGTAPRSVAVVGIDDGDMGASIASEVALASAESGSRVLLVEADLERPVLASRLGIAPTPGLSEYLGGSAAPREALRTVRARIDGSGAAIGIACVPAGGGAAGAGLGGNSFPTLVDRLSRAYDLVVYSSPPVAGSADAEILARLVDGVLLAVRQDGGDEDLTGAGRLLEGAPVVGVVVCER